MTMSETVNVDQWHEVEPFGPMDEGDVGGDWQVGTAWGRRFARRLPSGRWAVITDVFYTVADNTREGREHDDTEPNDIQNSTEFTVCRDLDDIGMTEELSDYQYDWAEGTPINDETTRALCARLRAGYYDWRPEDSGY